MSENPRALRRRKCKVPQIEFSAFRIFKVHIILSFIDVWKNN